MRSTLYNCYMHTSFCKIFCHFQTDKACSDHRTASGRSFLYVVVDTIGIGNISQGKYLIFLDSGNCRTDGSCTGRQHQTVIAFLIGFLPMTYCYRLTCCIYRCNLTLCPHVHIKSLMKTLRCLQLQSPLICDHSSHIVRKATVCIGNILPPFKHDNLCVFIISAKSGCCACSSCHASYDQYLHIEYLLFYFFSKSRLTSASCSSNNSSLL